MGVMENPQVKAAIWARVSTKDQDEQNQLIELRELAAARGYDVVTEIVTEDSAWASAAGGSNGKGKEFEARRTALLEGARLGKYQVVLVWGLDRLSRRGAEDMLAFTRKLSATGCGLFSLKDPWAEDLSNPMVRELLLGIFATIARFESERRSDRIRAGLNRRKAKGLPVGRAKGARDKKPRNRSGYVARWENERAKDAAS
jgi:DNA invertase Pin-like site-specific DNA recombinase